jgi:hypothetical protein
VIDSKESIPTAPIAQTQEGDKEAKQWRYLAVEQKKEILRSPLQETPTIASLLDDIDT